jgi:hypothetical protein
MSCRRDVVHLDTGAVRELRDGRAAPILMDRSRDDGDEGMSRTLDKLERFHAGRFLGDE